LANFICESADLEALSKYIIKGLEEQVKRLTVEIDKMIAERDGEIKSLEKTYVNQLSKLKNETIESNEKCLKLEQYKAKYLENSKIEKKESEEILKFDKNFDNFKKIIKKANELALNNNINFYFVYLSSRPKYAAKYDGENYKKVINLIEEYNIPIIDMHKFFKEHNDPLSMFPFRRQLHYNEIGYKFVANKIYEFITEHEKRPIKQYYK
jgi:hypothetical protein